MGGHCKAKKCQSSVQVNYGLRKIADQITYVNPDIVALQVRNSLFSDHNLIQIGLEF